MLFFDSNIKSFFRIQVFYCILFFFNSSFLEVFAQNNNKFCVLGSSGNFSYLSVGSLHFQLGEVLISNSLKPTENLYNGFIQPTPGFVYLKGNNNQTQLDFFPNPFSDLITMSSNVNDEFNFQLTDISGKSFENLMIVSKNQNQTQLRLNGLQPGTYFLFLKDKSNELIAVQKLIKIEN